MLRNFDDYKFLSYKVLEVLEAYESRASKKKHEHLTELEWYEMDLHKLITKYQDKKLAKPQKSDFLNSNFVSAKKRPAEDISDERSLPRSFDAMNDNIDKNCFEKNKPDLITINMDESKLEISISDQSIDDT